MPSTTCINVPRSPGACLYMVIITHIYLLIGPRTMLNYVNWVSAQTFDSAQYFRVMTLQLEIVSEHREIVGDDAVHIFREEGGTIGRSLQSDWILPDPDRFISGRHATIDYKGGIYYLVDTSSNGVYLNGDCEPLGKGNPRRLFNGDRLRMGDFEIVVSIDSGESIHMPTAEPLDGMREHAHSLVEEDPLKTGMLLLDEEEITGDDDFQSALFGDNDDTGVVEHAEEAVAEEIEEETPHEPAPLREADLVATDLLDSFLDGLKINRAELRSDTDLAELMQNAGEVMREFVEGGGYERPELWRDEDWQWRQRVGLGHPVFWKREDGVFTCRTLFDSLALDRVVDWPVYVIHAEAEAF